MVRIRLGWLAASLALVVGTAACKKDEKKSEPASPEKAVEKGDKPAAEKPAAPGASLPVNANADDLALLPVDAEAVIGLNFEQLQKSMLWKKFAEPKLMSGDVQQKLGAFKDKCGFDPFTAVKTVSIGVKDLGGVKPGGAMVVHGLDKTKVMACFAKEKAEKGSEFGKVDIDGDIVAVTKDGDKYAFTFTSDTTMLAVFGANADVAGVKAAASGSSALRTSPAFVEMYSKINTQDSLWLLVNGSSKAFDKVAQMGVKPKFVFGSINVTDGLTVDLRVRLDTPDQAAQLSGLAKGQIATAKAMFDKLEIGNEGPDVKVAVALSAQKLEALVKQVGGLVGGMAGGMGGP
jgi:hypothetical protein